MVNRRTTLLAMLGAGIARATAGPLLAQNGSAPARAPADAHPAANAGAGDQAMQADLARLGSHEYSDEGIPVFLACVNLVAEKTGQPTAPATDLSKRVAADLRRYGDAWHTLHPDAPDSDASKVIEVLAERDFGRSHSGDKQ